MLTAVIWSGGPANALAATFSALIPAVSEGILGHAVVVDSGADPENERIADATGASYVRASAAGGWQAGAAAARGDWLLLLSAGDAPALNWAQIVERHLMLWPGRAALMPVSGFAAALRERAALAFGSRRLRAGLVAPRGLVLAGRLDASPLRLSVRRERGEA